MKKVYQLKIETQGTFLLKTRPTGKALCKKLKNKVSDGFLQRMQKELFAKGWADREIVTGISVQLGDPFGNVLLTVVPMDVL